MMLASVVASGYEVPIGEAAVTALLGYSVVFFGLFMLMIVVTVMGKIMAPKAKKAVPAAPAAVAPVAEEPAGEPAPGSAGKLKLYDTPDREAAMIMAIVADKLNKPLNELRFISIKEVK